MPDIWSSPATWFSSTSARMNMSNWLERSRPPLVWAVSIATAKPSKIQRGCHWFGIAVLPMILLSNAGRPDTLSTCMMCVYSWVISSFSQSS